MNSTIVAACQYKPELLDVRKNIVTAQILVHEAAAKGARIIVLPELAMSGFTLQNDREAMSVAQQRNGYQTEAFVPLAQRYGCYVVLGYVELYEKKLYNSAVTIGPTGVCMNAQKKNLHGSDNLWATPNESLSPVLSTPYGRLGTLICKDVSNNFRESYRFHRPDHRFYKRGSLDCVSLLTNWGAGYSYPDSSWVDLAESIDTNVIVSNRVGKERDMQYKGGSVVITRSKKVWTNGSSFHDAAVVGGLIEL